MCMDKHEIIKNIAKRSGGDIRCVYETDIYLHNNIN